MTLAELMADLERRAQVAEQEGAIAPVANIYRRVVTELATVNGDRAVVASPHLPGAHLLNVNDAAARLGVPVGWLYRRAKTLPFARRLGLKTLRFDPVGLDAWTRRHR